MNHLIFKIWERENKSAIEGVCGIDESSQFNLPEENVHDRDGTVCKIRILVLGTPTAMSTTANYNKLVQDAISKLNIIFSKSFVLNAEAVLAGNESIAFDETGLDFDQVIDNLVLNPFAIQRKQATGADLVMMFVAPQIMVDNGTIGIAKFGGQWAVARNFSSDLGRVFSHEIGHNLSAHHEACTTPGAATGSCNLQPNPPAEAHILIEPSGALRQTIMFSSNRTSLIDHFSNPNVLFKTVPTGVTGISDNAGVLRGNVCNVSNNSLLFQDNYGVLIKGPSQGCFDEGIQFTSTVSGNAGICTYEWRKAIGGVNYGGVIGTASYLNFIVPDEPPGTLITFKLKVTNQAGQITTAFKHFIVVNQGCGNNNINPMLGNPANPIEATINYESNSLIFPNPAQNDFTVEIFANEKAENTEFSVKNRFGIEVLVNKLNSLEKGRNLFTIDCSNLPNGIYYFTVKSQLDISGCKFIILK
jgi:hypothetical protein